MDQLWHYETFIKHLIFAVRQKNHKRSICALGKVRRKARQSANYGGMLESLKFDIMKQIIVRTFQQPDITADNESRIRLILEFYSCCHFDNRRHPALCPKCNDRVIVLLPWSLVSIQHPLLIPYSQSWLYMYTAMLCNS